MDHVGDWASVRKAITKKKRKRRYEDNAIQEKEERRQRYWKNVDDERSKRIERYVENKEQEKETRRDRYRNQALRRFFQLGKFGPSFPCLVCHELKWLENVDVVHTLDQIDENYLCVAYILEHKHLFYKLGGYFCCKSCRKQVDAGVLPSVAARNGLLCPWDEVELKFLNLTTVRRWTNFR